MTGLSFVDANVFVYASDPRDPAKQVRSTQWLAVLWRESSGRTSTQVLSETYVTLSRLARAEAAGEYIWHSVQKYFAWTPLPNDEPLMRRAREVERRHRISWWDAMVVAAAQVQGCEVLLTEDLQDGGVFGTVTVRSPFTLDLRQPVAGYDVRVRVEIPHRRRGRPRRTATENRL